MSSAPLAQSACRVLLASDDITTHDTSHITSHHRLHTAPGNFRVNRHGTKPHISVGEHAYDEYVQNASKIVILSVDQDCDSVGRSSTLSLMVQVASQLIYVYPSNHECGYRARSRSFAYTQRVATWTFFTCMGHMDFNA